MTRQSERRWACVSAVLCVVCVLVSLWGLWLHDWFMVVTMAVGAITQAYWCRFSLERSRTLT